jgi:hypothetical protein
MPPAPAPSFLLECAPPVECGGAPFAPPPPEGEEAVRPSREDGVPAVSIRQHTCSSIPALNIFAAPNAKCALLAADVLY